MAINIISKNKKAFHEYEILERYEAGIVLEGSEVKALRLSRVNLKDSFVRIDAGEIYVYGMHITHLTTSNMYYRSDEKRARKLLLHKKEIKKLFASVSQKGLSIIPLKIYFNHKNKAKIEISLARGKTLYDKRETLKKRDGDRQAQIAMKKYI